LRQCFDAHALILVRTLTGISIPPPTLLLGPWRSDYWRGHPVLEPDICYVPCSSFQLKRPFGHLRCAWPQDIYRSWFQSCPLLYNIQKFLTRSIKLAIILGCLLPMANSDPDNWNASLQNNFAVRSGILVRRPFLSHPLAHIGRVLQLLAEVGVVSFVAVTILLAISVVSSSSWCTFDGYESLALPTASCH
jgi:hypothetical protein